MGFSSQTNCVSSKQKGQVTYFFKMLVRVTVIDGGDCGDGDEEIIKAVMMLAMMILRMVVMMMVKVVRKEARLVTVISVGVTMLVW